MKDLEKMKKSCSDFAGDLKTGNVVWIFDFDRFFCEVHGNELLFWLSEYEGKFSFVQNNKYKTILQATTAKEAAFEALELVKKEAQKLVDALDFEPKHQLSKLEQKEPFWIPIDQNNYPAEEVLTKNKINSICIGYLGFNGDLFQCEGECDLIRNPTHYAQIESLLKLT